MFERNMTMQNTFFFPTEKSDIFKMHRQKYCFGRRIIQKTRRQLSFNINNYIFPLKKSSKTSSKSFSNGNNINHDSTTNSIEIISCSVFRGNLFPMTFLLVVSSQVQKNKNTASEKLVKQAHKGSIFIRNKIIQKLLLSSSLRHYNLLDQVLAIIASYK